MRIETHHPKVRWSWVVWMVLPWATLTYEGMCSGAPMTFTIRKFVENPSLIAFISSINFAFNFLVGAVTSYMSDRIWTRWGRRKTLLIVGWTGSVLTLFFIPLAPNLWVLVILIVIYQFCSDVGMPYEPLYNEVIPPSQRGRASTMRNILQQVTGLFANAVMLAQFDRQYDLNALGRTWTLTGEKAVFWLGSGAVLLTLLFLIFKVRETPPPESIRRERFSPARFFRDLFGERQWWMIYLLYVCPYLTMGGIGSYAGGGVGSSAVPLFLTEQLGFTKAQIYVVAGWVSVGNMLLFVPLFGYMADRLPRLKLFRFAVLLPAVVNLCFFLYARFVVDYQVPHGVFIGFNVANEALMSMMFILWGPLVYDYIPSNRYGTVSAGFSFVGGVVIFLLVNGAGQFVALFTRIFGARGLANYDHSSGFIWQFGTACLAFAIVVWFGREVKRGRVIPYARREFENRDPKAAAGEAASVTEG